MTTEKYKLKLSEAELEILSDFIKTSMSVTFLDVFDPKIADIEHYESQRMQQRSKRPDITWPAELSKKERVICKINMINTMLYSCIADDENSNVALVSAKEYIKNLLNEIFKYNATIGNPWPGISNDAAKFLNVLYVKIYAAYQEKLNAIENTNRITYI